MPIDALDEESLVRAAKALARRDKQLTHIFESYGSPPLWARKPGFSTLIQIILEQQVSLASAAAIFGRLKKSVVPFQPQHLIELGADHLTSIGLTRQKTAYCLHLAQSLTDRSLNLSRLHHLNDADARVQLMAVKGLGPWSADIYLLMALRRADIWPANDLALATAVTSLKQLRDRPTSVELLAIAEAWRPFRSVAARMLWQYYLDEKQRVRRARTN